MIGIANTMDFPERLLHKIASRIGTYTYYKFYKNKKHIKVIEELYIDHTQAIK